MKTDLKFVWIDDNSDRRKDSENFSDQLGVDIDFLDIKNKLIEKILHDFTERPEPDLIILDHSLDQTLSETYKKGSTAAAYLHEKWPGCPIISFTGVPLNDIDIRQQSAYEGMYPINRISEYGPLVLSIANGFRFLKTNKPADVSSLLDYLKCPESEKEKVIKVLPSKLKENFDDTSLSLEIYRWCKFTFFERPGFLYNKIWAATFLGLTEKGFESVEEFFESAVYTGIFQDVSNKKWWKSSLLEILGDLVGDVGLPWVIGRKLVNDDKLYSKCFSSNEEIPETVAAEDTTFNTNWRPMKLKYTEPHPYFEDLLFYEELRIMIPA